MVYGLFVARMYELTLYVSLDFILYMYVHICCKDNNHRHELTLYVSVDFIWLTYVHICCNQWILKIITKVITDVMHFSGPG